MRTVCAVLKLAVKSSALKNVRRSDLWQTGGMSTIRTARERARAEVGREIKAAAHRQLGDVGAAGLSLRAVARELGMASSALYRYFASRDALLTELIVDAYDAIGDRIEAADRKAVAHGSRARWRAVCTAARGWAIAAPHDYALVYGSPVPGYEAPQDTVGPAGRVPLALLRIVHDAWTAGELTPADDELTPELAEQAEQVAGLGAEGVPAPVVARTVIAWTQLFGMLSFELFGHLKGSMDPSAPFFDYAVERAADLIGLPSRSNWAGAHQPKH